MYGVPRSCPDLALIGARRPDNANDRAATTQRNALPEPYLRRPAARPGRNVIVHPSPLYLPGDALPGGTGVLLGAFLPR